MYELGGVAYVYLCYGMHNLFNVVTADKDIPHAVLIRALIPKVGIDLMRQRRKIKLNKTLTNGPGALCAALGISRKQTGAILTKSPIWIEEPKEKTSQKIKAGPRVGIDYAGQDAHLP